MSCTDDTDLDNWLAGVDPEAPTGPGPLTDYDVIIVNTSAGKDSQTMLRLVANLAAEQGVTDRVVVVHAILRGMEWEGTLELAQAQADLYGLRFLTCGRDETLLDYTRRRRRNLDAQGKVDAPAWPSSASRWCTSDFKRAPIRKVMTALVRELGGPKTLGRPARLLNCMGLRAAESRARADRAPFRYDGSASSGVRDVWEWLPIHDWTTDEVWTDIRASGAPYHPAYDAGMSRLSCCLCVLGSKHDLVTSARLNPGLAAEYAAVEIEVRSKFKKDLSMAQIIDLAAAGDGPVNA